MGPTCSRMRMYFWHQQGRLKSKPFSQVKTAMVHKLKLCRPLLKINPPMLITRIHKESSMCLECCYGAHHLGTLVFTFHFHLVVVIGFLPRLDKSKFMYRRRAWVRVLPSLIWDLCQRPISRNGLYSYLPPQKIPACWKQVSSGK